MSQEHLLLEDVSKMFEDMAKKTREEDPSLSYKWFTYSEACRKAAQRETPERPELEGGGAMWFFVCGDCHGALESHDLYCRHCGRRLDWDE